MEEQLTLDKTDDSVTELTKSDFRQRNFDVYTPCKTRYYILIACIYLPKLNKVLRL